MDDGEVLPPLVVDEGEVDVPFGHVESVGVFRDDAGDSEVIFVGVFQVVSEDVDEDRRIVRTVVQED